MSIYVNIKFDTLDIMHHIIRTYVYIYIYIYIYLSTSSPRLGHARPHQNLILRMHAHRPIEPEPKEA